MPGATYLPLSGIVEGTVYVRGMHCRRLGEERYFLVAPVDEDMMRRREDVRGATLREKNGFLKFI